MTSRSTSMALWGALTLGCSPAASGDPGHATAAPADAPAVEPSERAEPPSGGAPVAPESPPNPTPREEAPGMPSPESGDPSPADAIECTRWSACVKHDGQRVAIVGRYTVERPLAGRKGGGDVTRVRIIPEGGRRGAYLAPLWHADSTRPDDERTRLDGKLVRAVGRLHLEAPEAPDQPPHAARMGGACLHPVESVDALDRPPR